MVEVVDHLERPGGPARFKRFVRWMRTRVRPGLPGPLTGRRQLRSAGR